MGTVRQLRPSRTRWVTRTKDDTGKDLSERDRFMLDEIERIRMSQEPWESRVQRQREIWDGTQNQHYWVTNPYTGECGPSRIPSAEIKTEWMSPDIQSTVEQYAATNAKVDSKFVCEPHTDAQSARLAAAAGSRVLTSLRRSLKAQELRRWGSRLSHIDGEVHAMPIFNWGTGCTEIVRFEAREVFFSGGVEFSDDCEWVASEKWEPLQKIRHRWNPGDDKKSEGRKLKSTAYANLKKIEPDISAIPASVRARLDATGGQDRLTTEDDVADFVRTLNVYTLPCDDYPDGCWTIFCNDTPIFTQESLPFAANGLVKPIYTLQYLHKPGLLRGIGLVQQSWSTVAITEDLVNQVVDNIKAGMWGKVLVDSRAVNLDAAGGWTTEGAQIIPWNSTISQKPIQLVQPMAVPQNAMQPVAFFTQKQRELSGLNDPNRGAGNGGASTLGEVQIDVAAGQNIAQGHYIKIDEWERDIMECLVVLEQQNASDERLQAMIGTDRTAEFQAFKAARFINTGNLTRTVEVVVQSASSLSSNPALKQQQIEWRMANGLMDATQARDVLDEPLPADSMTSNWEDNKRLLRELVVRAKAGQQPQVSPFWNHAAMLQAVGQIVTQDDYIDLPPPQKMAVDQLFAEIEQAWMERTRGAAELAGPGVPPAPPPDPNSANNSQSGLTSGSTSQKVVTNGPQGPSLTGHG